ncbi:glycosyltransferase family 2 protein [Clostridium sp. UBA1056]|uniref:glycosyltransferase family 2 protein n=1 Tax=unclassified Clostridium TaxID=2614128 RepID=UPI003216982B
MKISIIIPCFNEEKVLIRTYEKLTEILLEYEKTNMCDYELIFINDGSSDNTKNVLINFSKEDDHAMYISFSRNFGKEAAMLAGLKNATGDAAIIIDSDLQHPPELIPQMVEHYKSGYDQVICRRNRNGEKIVRKKLSQLYYKIVNKFVDVELIDGVGDFRLLSRKAVDNLLSLTEYNRFSKGLFSWIGFETKYIDYDNKEREIGESKWSFKSLLQYGVDGIISFNNKPLRSIIYLGAILLLLSIVYIIITLVGILINGIDSPGYFTLITAVLIIGGVQLISIGVIGEYIGRIYYEVKKRPHYIIKDTNINDKELKE